MCLGRARPRRLAGTEAQNLKLKLKLGLVPGDDTTTTTTTTIVTATGKGEDPLQTSSRPTSGRSSGRCSRLGSERILSDRERRDAASFPSYSCSSSSLSSSSSSSAAAASLLVLPSAANAAEKRGLPSSPPLRALSTSSTLSSTSTDSEGSEVLVTSPAPSLSPLKSCLKNHRQKALVKNGVEKNEKRSSNKSVRFDAVNVRVYGCMMGDATNSYCGSGPPIILSNGCHVELPAVTLDEYEYEASSFEKRSAVRTPRGEVTRVEDVASSSSSSCRYAPLTAAQRRRILMDRWGYSFREVMERERQINAVKARECKASWSLSLSSSSNHDLRHLHLHVNLLALGGAVVGRWPRIHHQRT